jgi:hypothetical protein
MDIISGTSSFFTAVVSFVIAGTIILLVQWVLALFTTGLSMQSVNLANFICLEPLLRMDELILQAVFALFSVVL